MITGRGRGGGEEGRRQLENLPTKTTYMHANIILQVLEVFSATRTISCKC